MNLAWSSSSKKLASSFSQVRKTGRDITLRCGHAGTSAVTSSRGRGCQAVRCAWNESTCVSSLERYAGNPFSRFGDWTRCTIPHGQSYTQDNWIALPVLPSPGTHTETQASKNVVWNLFLAPKMFFFFFFLTILQMNRWRLPVGRVTKLYTLRYTQVGQRVVPISFSSYDDDRIYYYTHTHTHRQTHRSRGARSLT